MKDVKYRLEIFSFYDHTGIVQHLEKMALKGWLFIGRNALCWKYRRMEPRQVHFAVTYFPGASEFDPEPSEEQQIFKEFCEKEGWQYISSVAQMQIFMNEQEEPVPIETDALLQVENMHQAMKKNFLVGQYLLLGVGVLQMALFLYRMLSDPIGLFSSNANLFSVSCWLVVLLVCAVELISYYRWRSGALKAAEVDRSILATRGNQKIQWILLIFVLAVFIGYLLPLLGSWESIVVGISLACVTVLMVLVHLIKYILKKLRASAVVNRTVTIASCFVLSFVIMGSMMHVFLRMAMNGVFDREPVETYEYNGWTWDVYMDELPLTLEDMMDDIDREKYSYQRRTEESLLMAKFEGSQRGKMTEPGLPDLKYEIIKIKTPILYKMCLNQLIRKYSDPDTMPPGAGYSLLELEAQNWNAEKIYQRYSDGIPMDWYIICMDDKIIDLVCYWENVTDDQMKIMREKLSIL